MDLNVAGTMLLVALLSILLVVWFYKSIRPGNGRLPPGPPTLPIFGNLFQMDIRTPHKSLVKGTFVLPLLSSVLKSTKDWDTPESFNPNHFLDEKGAFKMNEGFIAFSAGKRICLGEPLARMELFLFLTTLLQNFVFKSVINHKDIDTSPLKTGILMVPHLYKFFAVCR